MYRSDLNTVNGETIVKLNETMVKNMSKCKIYVSFDEQKYFWIVVDRQKFIRYPTEEDLKNAQVKYYNKTNVCYKCKTENKLTDNSILYPGNVRRETDINQRNTGKWVCGNCERKNYQKHNPNSTHSIQKLFRDHRTGHLKDPRRILANNCEKVTEKWLGAERLSIKYDNYRLPLDHGFITKHIKIMVGNKLIDLYEKIPQTKGFRLSCGSSGFLVVYERWEVSFVNEYGKQFDYLIFYCISRDEKSIERIYIFPIKEINMNNISISKYVKRWIPWYEIYRVNDEKILNEVNIIYKGVLEYER